MLLLREVAASLAFLAALILLALLFDVFSWGYCILAIGCLVLAYLLWPSKKRGQRQGESRFLDWLEVLIELPFDLLSWLLRLLLRLLRGAEGVDL
jgi:hypothetical protein